MTEGGAFIKKRGYPLDRRVGRRRELPHPLRLGASSRRWGLGPCGLTVWAHPCILPGERSTLSVSLATPLVRRGHRCSRGSMAHEAGTAGATMTATAPFGARRVRTLRPGRVVCPDRVKLPDGPRADWLNHRHTGMFRCHCPRLTDHQVAGPCCRPGLTPLAASGFLYCH